VRHGAAHDESTPMTPMTRLVARLLLASALVAPAAHAQLGAAPSAEPVTVPAAPVAAPAAPPPAIPVPLPALSDAQAKRLQAWLADDAGQGLSRASRTAKAVTLTGDALSRAVLDRARAMRTGRLSGGDFLTVWAMRPAVYEPLADYTAAVTGNRLDAWLATLTPPYAGYEGLKRGLATYDSIAAAGGWPVVPAGPDLGLGATGARVATLRQRLAIEDTTLAPTGDALTVDLRDAVQRAQRRYGLNPTGVVGAATLASLNVPVRDRIGAIMANMERWRWLPRELPTHRVQVNIAAAQLAVFEGDKPVASMRAVTGSPDNQTPMLVSRIHSIVVNPPWNVPSSIAQRELWPKEKARPGYLKSAGYTVIGTPEGGQRIVQPAGPASALGRLKFDFDNPFAVYLHDTPSRGKFSSFDRLASHGCVRLEKPVDLAELMLATDPKWQGSAIPDAIATGKTQRVALPEQVSVYLLYWTAFASANGTINFREDPYGWDKLLAAKIEASNARAAGVREAAK